MSTEPSVDVDNLPKGQEFHASKPGSEPMMTGGVCFFLHSPLLFLFPQKSYANLYLFPNRRQHQPGYKVPDDVPTSHLTIHEPGTAPADKSFTPQVGSEVEPQVDTSKLEETAKK